MSASAETSAACCCGPQVSVYRRCCVCDVMWWAVYVVCHSKTAAPDIEPLGTCVSVRVFRLLYACVLICNGQAASHQCHSQRRRKTLMLFHTDTCLTPLSSSLTVLQADVCVLLCRTVTSHQTMNLNSGLKPILLFHNYISAPSLSSYSFLFFQIFSLTYPFLKLKNLSTWVILCVWFITSPNLKPVLNQVVNPLGFKINPHNNISHH